MISIALFDSSKYSISLVGEFISSNVGSAFDIVININLHKFKRLLFIIIKIYYQIKRIFMLNIIKKN